MHPCSNIEVSLMMRVLQIEALGHLKHVDSYLTEHGLISGRQNPHPAAWSASSLERWEGPHVLIFASSQPNLEISEAT